MPTTPLRCRWSRSITRHFALALDISSQPLALLMHCVVCEWLIFPPFLLVSRCHVECKHLQTFTTCTNGSCSPPVTNSALPEATQASLPSFRPCPPPDARARLEWPPPSFYPLITALRLAPCRPVRGMIPHPHRTGCWRDTDLHG